MEKITILTYNVLSSNLADLMISEIKDKKQVYSPEIMNSDVRWEKVSDLIKKTINKYDANLVICLQEVSESWLPLFASLFTSLNYKYINVQYGRIITGNMGVLIAYPSYFEIIKSEFYCVGKHILVTNDLSSKAATKTNVAIMLLLENPRINFKFGIVTYHMPCEPDIPYIGLTHSKVLYKKIIKFMEDNSWILAGDFNMTQYTESYKYLASKCGCIWKDFLLSYPITNHAYILGKEFSGCIDYIFYSKSKLICYNVVYSNVKFIIHDKDEPSDHIPIIALFNLIR